MSVVVEGTVRYSYGDRDDCLCCPGRHVYARGIDVDQYDWQTRPYQVAEHLRQPEWLGWLQDQLAALGPEADGKRVRMTFEVLDS